MLESIWYYYHKQILKLVLKKVNSKGGLNMVIHVKNRQLTSFGIYVKQTLTALNWRQEDLVQMLCEEGFVIYKSKLSSLLHGSYNDKDGAIQKNIYKILKEAMSKKGGVKNDTYADS